MTLKDDSNIPSFHSGTPGTSTVNLPFANDTKHSTQPNDMGEITTSAIMRSDSRYRSAR